MKTIKAQNKGHVTLFRNPLLETLTKSNPLVSWVMFGTIIIFLLYHAIIGLKFSTATAVSLFFSGLLFWTLFEYLVHRFVFHWVSSHPFIEKITYLFHGNHHHFPRDRQRLIMPPVPGLLIAATVFSIMYFAGGEYAFMFFPGFILGHLLYASLHYAIHAWHPPFKWMKPLWRNHHLHHYSSEEKGFGVSSTFWDHVFGTTFDLEKHKEDKAKVKELMFEKKGKEN